ncbi:MAG: ribosome biogenesis GTPase Der [Candidatus Binatia bacterium]
MTAPLVEAANPALPIVALVGRPNVGKSTLFNTLVRARRAIVDDIPGVTRDRVTARAEHQGRAFLCVDTGGFAADEPRDAREIAALVRRQALAAIDEADVIVCVLDGMAGYGPADRDTVGLLRRSGKPVVWVVNKIDNVAREDRLLEFHRAGVGALLPVSAAHTRGLDSLRDAIVARLPPEGAGPAAEQGATRLALVGRPNVGKSSLLNRLLGTERAIVTAVPGTTRDEVDTPVVVDGVPYVLIDTAGIRRRSKKVDPLERHGAVRALGAIDRADLALVVLDATEGVTDQDAHIIGRAWDTGRGVILLANKWDQVPAAARDPERFARLVAETRPVFAALPLLCVSAITGAGLADLFGIVRKVAASHARTLQTAQLNRALAAAVTATPPPSPGGRQLRFYYAAQTATRPTTIAVFTSAPASVPTSYARYLTTRLIKAFRLVGVPLRLQFRSRRAEEQGARRAGRGRKRPTATRRVRAR